MFAIQHNEFEVAVVQKMQRVTNIILDSAIQTIFGGKNIILTYHEVYRECLNNFDFFPVLLSSHLSPLGGPYCITLPLIYLG